MSIIRQRVSGTLISGHHRTALRLEESGGELFLAFALLTEDGERQILPTSVLDDWGHEIKSAQLYDWIRENGDQFPRAEVFGVDLTGMPAQYFLRELDLLSRYPCYGYRSEDRLISEGVLIDTIHIVDSTVQGKKQIKPPKEFISPLHYARVSWWRVNRSYFFT